MSKSGKMLDKIYVVNLTREDIWLISDALRNMASMKSVRKKQVESLVEDFEKFEQKISAYLNKESRGDSE